MGYHTGYTDICKKIIQINNFDRKKNIKVKLVKIQIYRHFLQRYTKKVEIEKNKIVPAKKNLPLVVHPHQQSRRQTERQTGRQTERQTGRQTERQTGRQTDR